MGRCAAMRRAPHSSVVSLYELHTKILVITFRSLALVLEGMDSSSLAHSCLISSILLCRFCWVSHKSTDPILWGKYFLIAFLVVTAISSVLPQLLFKSQERILNVGPEGWDTQIGKKKGARSWGEVASVQEDSGKVVITNKNGNALIVPERAFISSDDRDRFYNDIKDWHATYKSANN